MADSLKGKLLVASPAIQDPDFRRTVVLIAAHAEEGAMGVVLNREAGVAVIDAVPDLSVFADPDESVWVGGPVAADGVVVLAEWDEPAEAAAVVLGDIGFLPADLTDFERLSGHTRRARVYAGHAGWGPGQLEAEMEEDSWIVTEPDREDVFTDEPDGLWAEVLRRLGREYALVATMPEDPSLN